MRTLKLLMAISGAALLLAGCDVKDTIYETDHPDQGQITLTTDWSAIGAGITKPTAWMAAYGSATVPVSAETYTFPNLIDPGSYTLYAYNTADNITLSGTTATASYSSGTLGWLFTGKLVAEVEKDTDHDFTINMAQQVRELTLIINPTGGTTDIIATITGTLSGVAGSYDMESGAHGAASSVALTFSKITSGADAGKWSATTRLLGVTGTEQKLTGTITFTGGNPPNQSLESDLTTALASYNNNKREPETLGGTVVETPTGAGFTATINDWTKVTGSGTAN